MTDLQDCEGYICAVPFQQKLRVVGPTQQDGPRPEDAHTAQKALALVYPASPHSHVSGQLRP